LNYQSAVSVTAGKFDRCLQFLSAFIAREFIIGLIIPYVSLNITENIIPQLNIFTKTRTQDSFRVYDLSYCNPLAETSNFILSTILSCVVSELLKPSSSGLEPRTIFCVVAFASVIFSPKRTHFALALFFPRL
jgi:hypothetical protein